MSQKCPIWWANVASLARREWFEGFLKGFMLASLAPFAPLVRLAERRWLCGPLSPLAHFWHLSASLRLAGLAVDWCPVCRVSVGFGWMARLAHLWPLSPRSMRSQRPPLHSMRNSMSQMSQKCPIPGRPAMWVKCPIKVSFAAEDVVSATPLTVEFEHTLCHQVIQIAGCRLRGN